jgi:hypothetical protein
MVPTLFFYQLVLVALVLLCVMLHWAWPSDPATCPPPSAPTAPKPKRHREPAQGVGLTTKPHCDTREHGIAPRPHASSTPPPRIVPTRGRRRQVDTSTHFCPNPDCAYRGWVGWGNLRAHGHPSGDPWRQLLCVACRGYFLETLGTLFHGKRASVELIVHVIACLAEDFLSFVKPNLSHFLPHLHYGLTTNPAGIIARTMTQHGHQDTQESVANSASDLAMPLSLRP